MFLSTGIQLIMVKRIIRDIRVLNKSNYTADAQGFTERLAQQGFWFTEFKLQRIGQQSGRSDRGTASQWMLPLFFGNFPQSSLNISYSKIELFRINLEVLRIKPGQQLAHQGKLVP